MHAASFISSGGKQETIFLRKPIHPKEKTSVFIPFVSLQPRKQHGSPAALLEPSEGIQLSFSLLPSMLKLAWSHLEIRPQYVSTVFLPVWWHWLHYVGPSELPWMDHSAHLSCVAQSCPTLFDLMNCSPPGSSVYGILQARILELVSTSFSRGSS